jgi:2-keto-4-pentenoate hydratase/2-oxohepta-3-ene-1,7-dioic acid hydratase in catechol pathway
LRTPSSVAPPFGDLVRPALSGKFDYEGELGIVIGGGGRYIRSDCALDAISGFTVLNDATARDWQRIMTQWTPGKNFDGTMPIGPEVVTVDEVEYSDLLLETRLNGAVMQSAKT